MLKPSPLSLPAMIPTVSSLEDLKESAQTRGGLHRSFWRLLFKIFLAFLALGGFGLYALSAYVTSNISVLPAARDAVFQLPCPEESTGLGRWIRPPLSLRHSMTDEELFWLASWVPQVRRYPFERVPRIAFMFLTKGPLPLSPLWEMFFKGHEGRYSIYVHSLPSYEANFTSTSVFYERQIPSKVVEWGTMSMCDAERRLLANALLDISNEWFVLLSESCIPLLPFNITYQYVIRSRYNFIGVVDDPGPYGRGRYNPEMEPEVSIEQWRKGAQWFGVNRKHAVSIIKDTYYYPIFEKYCRPHCYVDEHYFPTMLFIESPNHLANRSLTWVDWSRGGAHPATFGKKDITEAFLKRIISSGNCSYNDQPSSICYLFARKFAPSSLESLLQLAPTFLSYG